MDGRRMAENVHQLRAKPGDTEKITINLGYVDLGHVDLMVQEGFYSNRTDFIANRNTQPTRTPRRRGQAVHGPKKTGPWSAALHSRRPRGGACSWRDAAHTRARPRQYRTGCHARACSRDNRLGCRAES